MRFRIRPLDKAVVAAEFDCGSQALADYIRRYAAQDVRRNVARVFVATPEDDAERLAGFYSLSAGSVACADLPAALAKKLPRYPVPVALLGRLAVDVAFQRKGLGSILLADACRKVALAGSVVAVAGIIVDAKDDAAMNFYRRFGFQALPGKAGRLLLPSAAYSG
jgi:ribosomal protein S18 acetylase RimI-like enzyme